MKKHRLGDTKTAIRENQIADVFESAVTRVTVNAESSTMKDKDGSIIGTVHGLMA